MSDTSLAVLSGRAHEITSVEMTITSAEYAAHLAQRAAKGAAPVKEGWTNEALTVWVPGTPANLKNKVGHWSKRARWAKDWRARTAFRLLNGLQSKNVPKLGLGPRNWPWSPEEPKLVTFTIYGRARFDDDNVALVCSPCRDALQDMQLIDNDGNVAHRFQYEQAPPTRKAGSVYGIAITIALRKD